MERAFRDRIEGGRALAERFADLRGRDDVLVLGLARGGVPVAKVVADAIGAPLDAFIVRKLGAPGHEELAMGAVASGDVTVLNEDIQRWYKATPEQVAEVQKRELAELHRREIAYRGTTDAPDVRGKTVVLVDDGLATGTSMKAAVQAVKALGPTEVMIGVPVGAPDTVRDFEAEGIRVECVLQPKRLMAIGMWYVDFLATRDEDVRAALGRNGDSA